MNALAIAQSVYRKCGLHGELISFSSPEGSQQIACVEAVKEAWWHLQSMRSEWTFMDSHTTFQTVSGISSYATSAIMANESTDDLSFILPGGVIYNNRPLNKLRWEDYFYMDNTVPAEPRWYTWDQATETLHMNIPNGVYDITIRYHREPQYLTSGTQVPRLPKRFHILICYEALQGMATFLANDEVFARYSQQYDELLGELMRGYLPSKTVRIPRGFV